MRESSDRRTRTWTVAGLALAAFGFLAWVVVRASSSPIASAKGDVAEAGSTEDTRSDPPLPTLERGTRVAEAIDSGAETAVAASFDPSSPAAAPAAKRTVLGRIRLVGRVIAPDGALLDGPQTRIEVNGPFDTRAAQVSRGAYAIDGLAPGRYQVRCSAGLRDETRPVFLAPGEEEHREDFVLTPLWNVAIRLVSTDGRSLADVDASEGLPADMRLNVVALSGPPPASWSARSYEGRTARRNSRYFPRTMREEVSGDPDGTCSGRLEVYLPPPVHLAAEISGVVLGSTRLDVEEKVATIEIALDRVHALQCSLRGRVVKSEDGTPIVGATAELFLSGGPLMQFASDDDGAIRKGELAPGSCTLMISSPGRGMEARPIELLPGIENNLGTIALAESRHIRGRFVDRAGNGVKPLAFVMTCDEARPLPALVLATGVRVDDQGRFEAANLAPRSFVVSSTASFGRNAPEWASAPVVVDVSHGSVDGLVIEARPAIRVTLHPVSPEVRGFDYWILSQDGVLCTRGSFPDQGDQRVYLGSGRFKLCVGSDVSSAREIPFEVGDEPMTIPIEP